MNPRTTGQYRYLTTNSAQTDFEIAAGRQTLEFNTDLKHWQPSSGTFKASQKLVLLGGYRGARFQFFGTGADNATASYRLWIARAQYSADAVQARPDASKMLDVDLVPWIANGGSPSVITLSSVVGATGAVAPQILSTERIADTLTFNLSSITTTPPGPATAIEAAYGMGVTAVYSPGADASPAELYVPDFGSGVMGFFLEFDITGATGMNSLFELTK